MSGTTTADIARRVRDAHATSTSLRIVGAGTWLDAGAPCVAAQRLDTAGLTGILEYEPGDLTLTARAATRLDEIADATAQFGQWLPLDPFGTGGTLGATVATASYGPLAAAFGTPRDQVLGCEVVTGTGDIVRAGGKVVKNVAGFDITRLMVGAWGTLGALTEVTVRLRARPEAETTIAIVLGTFADVERAQRWRRTSEFAPLAAEVLSPALARRIGIPDANAPVLLLRLGGNPSYLAAALHAAGSLGQVTIHDVALWQALALSDGATDAVIRCSAAPSGFSSLWTAVHGVVERAGGVAHANLTRGVIRCVLPTAGDRSADTLRGTLMALPPCTRIPERLPAPLWKPVALDAVTHSLAMGVRRVFDPGHWLNPGIMGTLNLASS
jgi:glycolate oxidase FAD binding subunit